MSRPLRLLGRLRLPPSSRLSKANLFKLPPQGSRLLPKAVFRRPRRCSAASVLPSSKGTTATAGAAALAIVVGKAAGATSAGDGPSVVDAAGAIAGHPDAI